MINVNELTDVELNRAMIWCYNKNKVVIDQNSFVWYERGFVDFDELNYLTDWNLTMPLAVENRLWPQPAKAGTGWFCYDTGNKYSSYLNQNPLRAICEVLVRIKLEQKQ